jgi:rhamnulokinase
MSRTAEYLAFDLGAESGRGVLGRFDGSRLTLEELHRFPNVPVTVHGAMYWDVLRIFDELRAGLGTAHAAGNGRLAGVGVDTWGVDFGLLEHTGRLLGNPVHYRDKRTDGVPEQLFAIVPKPEVYELTGIQFMQINTLFQMYSMVLAQSPQLKSASTLLLMAGLMNYYLCGAKVAEFTLATTTQMYNPRTGKWAEPMLERLGIPTDILPEIVPPGTVVGNLGDELWPGATVPVIAAACHDTAAAVAAVPARGGSWAYLSCGTWSLLGMEVDKPIITEESCTYDITNEGGVNNTFRFLKNIMGLWLLQASRRKWAEDGDDVSYSQITGEAAESAPFVSFVDPDNARFLAPSDMPHEIRASCRETGQPVPEGRGALARCVLESLALKCRFQLDRLLTIAGSRIDVLHMVGGGIQNKLLCQMISSATKVPVLAGPVEATAAGNILVQLMATGAIGSIDEGRELVRSSFPLEEYVPQDSGTWDDAYARFLPLLSDD